MERTGSGKDRKMNNTAFSLFHKELRRLVEQRKRDGAELPEILRELSDRIGKMPDREYTAEQTEKIIRLVITSPARKMGETTYWIHWESGVINCAGKDLDKVKDLATELAEENGMAYFIT